LAQLVDALREGAVVAYPTDSCYALGCVLESREAQQRIRAIRGVGSRHNLTLVCRDLSELGQYARVDNNAFRLIKRLVPGPYAFILRGSQDLPKRVLTDKQRTVGLRVPDNAVVQALLAANEGPILSSTLQLPGDDHALFDIGEILERLDGLVDWVIEAGPCPPQTCSVVEFSGDTPEIVRRVSGDLSFLD
jgi:tRNA threonylcarbamoyl adenosine modification protein (Sua5/YciO/YrdC/YwlC family)